MNKESRVTSGDNLPDSSRHSQLRRELRERHYEVLGKRTVEALERHGMRAHYAPSREQALHIALDLIPEGSTVGRGDSLTLYEVGLVSALSDGPYDFIDPYSEKYKHLTVPELLEFWNKILLCDVFLTGMNAVTLDGCLVNVDAGGNRVAPLLFGPRRVIVVAGANKLVPTWEDGLKRVREIAAPRNASRVGYRVPCVETGSCTDCDSPSRICRQFVVVKRDSGDALYGEPRIHVIIVGEELGL
jgi:L-lactate utilization protein LutB